MATPAGSNGAQFKRQRRELVLGPATPSGNRISEQRMIRAFLIKKKCHMFLIQHVPSGLHNEHVPFSSSEGCSYEYYAIPNNT